MSFLSWKPVLDAVSFVIAASGGVTLAARLFKRWQTADIAHVVWAIFSLIGVAFFSAFLVLGYAPLRFWPMTLLGTAFTGLVLYRSADRIRRWRHGQIIRPSRRLNVLIIALYIACLHAGAVTVWTIPPPNPPLASVSIWKPSPGLVNQLAPETGWEGYNFRQPPGFALTMRQNRVLRSVADIYEWDGPIRPDETRAIFVVRIIHPQPGYYPNDNLTELLSQRSEAYSDTHRNYTASGIQFGNLNGLEFSRLHWQGFWPRTRKVDNGLIYLTTIPEAIITITASDAEPYQQTTLPLCEAAALTFHKT